MSEFVVSINFGKDYVLYGEADVELCEPIVRCRDCAHASPAGLGCDPDELYCVIMDWIMAPDGFCSFGRGVMEMEVRPLTERAGVIDLYDANGSFVGKANVGVKIMLADGFYVPERACRFETHQEPEGGEVWSECGECGSQFGWDGWQGIESARYCPSCGARVIEEES